MTSLRAWVRSLATGPLAPARVAALLSTPIDPESLAPHVFFRPGRYARNLIYRDASVEVLCLCWDRGAESPVHGHAGQRCWLSVLEGELAVQSYDLLGGGRVPGPAIVRARGAVERIGRGDVDARDPENDLHRVLSPRGRTVSLHVYAAPIDACLLFDPARELCREARLYYDSAPADGYARSDGGS